MGISEIEVGTIVIDEAMILKIEAMIASPFLLSITFESNSLTITAKKTAKKIINVLHVQNVCFAYLFF